MSKTKSARKRYRFRESFLIVLLICIFGFGCGSSSEATDEEEMLRGWVTRSNIEDPQYPRFEARYDTVQISRDVVDIIRELNDGVEWTIVFGSWCSDSWREVPTFLKIADSAGIDVSRIRFYAVDRSKKGGEGLTDQYDIEMVPTFLFFKGGEEIGRIVEKPEGSMEDAILSILAGSAGE